MMKTLLLCAASLALTAPAAHPYPGPPSGGGVSLNWGTVCYTEAPMSALTFACDTNEGSSVMTVSFKESREMTDMVGVELRINGISASVQSMPDWWKLGAAPDCRTGQIQFSAEVPGAETGTCVNWAPGVQKFMAPNYVWTNSTWPSTNLGYSTITNGIAIDAVEPFDMPAGVEFYAGQVTILHGRTVGANACSGCSTGMLLVLDNVTVAGLSGTRDDFEDPFPGGNQCLIWNSGAGVGCSEPVPARTTTWGQVKSLYR